MSTVKFNTWQNTDGTENYKCRAWLQYNQYTDTVVGMAGITSVSDLATGIYQVNLANTMPDTAYTVIASNGAGGGGTDCGACGVETNGYSYTTTSFVVESGNASTGGNQDRIYNSVAVFR